MTPDQLERIKAYQDEVWRNIPGYIGRYKISNYGRVMNLRNNRIQKSGGYKSKNYQKTGLYKDGGNCKTFDVHKLVALVFLGNPKSKLDVNHKDHNKHNNHVSNLEWVNKRENVCHRLSNNNKKLIGCHFNKNKNLYLSTFGINKRQFQLGGFKSEEEAHIMHLMALVFYQQENKYV